MTELFNKSFESEYGLVTVRVVDDCPKLLLQIDNGDIILTNSYMSNCRVKFPRIKIIKNGIERKIGSLQFPEDVFEEAFRILQNVNNELSKENKLDKTTNIILLSTAFTPKEHKMYNRISYFFLGFAFILMCVSFFIDISSMTEQVITLYAPVLVFCYFVGVWAYVLPLFARGLEIGDETEPICWTNKIYFVDNNSDYPDKREQDIQKQGAIVRKAIFLTPLVLVFLILAINIYAFWGVI